MAYFKVESFINKFAKQEIIETKDIANWIECSVRHVQKFAKMNSLPFSRNHGRKNYLWNKETVRNFAKWNNRKADNTLVKPKIKKHEKELPKNQDSIIIREIAYELCPPPYHYEEEIKNKVRGIQYWAKKHDVPFEYYFGRKYYIFTKELKKQFFEYHLSKERNCFNLTKELRAQLLKFRRNN